MAQSDSELHLNLAVDDSGAPEIFRSFQGEGPMTGRVRTFVRLSGCNLHCRWCDTPYTWNWRGTAWPHDQDAPGHPHKYDPKAERVALSVDETAARIDALPAGGVVITGGEPLMQRAGLRALAQKLKADAPDRMLEVETNGTIVPDAETQSAIDLFVVSPKLAHSGNDAEIALQPETLTRLAALDGAVFKFVIRSAEDLDAVAALAERCAIPAERIYAMPEGVTAEQISRRGAAICDAVLERGYGFSDRLHIRLFGDTRGT